MVAHADAIVGRIVGTLDRLGIRDETLVLFTADNGIPRQITKPHGGRPHGSAR